MLKGTLRFRPENIRGAGPDTGVRQSLFLPVDRTPIVRTLVMDESRAPQVEIPRASRGPTPQRQDMLVKELPAEMWRVDNVPLTALAITWLDDPTVGRFIYNRRSIIITNQDTANPIWIRHVDAGVIAGGWIAPSASVSLPLASACRVYAQSVAVAGNVSFYQLS